MCYLSCDLWRSILSLANVRIGGNEVDAVQICQVDFLMTKSRLDLNREVSKDTLNSANTSIVNLLAKEFSARINGCLFLHIEMGQQTRSPTMGWSVKLNLGSKCQHFRACHGP